MEKLLDYCTRHWLGLSVLAALICVLAFVVIDVYLLAKLKIAANKIAETQLENQANIKILYNKATILNQRLGRGR